MNKLKTNMYQTAAFVAALGGIEKFLGFLYRVFLSRAIGSEGLGVYQIAFSVFAVLATAVSSGIPTSVSRLITKNRAENVRRGESGTTAAGILLALSASLPVVALVLLFRDKLNFIFSDERCMGILILMLPALVFSSVYAVLRGALWGNRRFFAYSVAELIEETAMIAAGTLLVLGAADSTDGAKMAARAITISSVAALAAATVFYICGGGRLSSPKEQLKPLFSSAAPITAMRTASSIVNSIVAIVLPARLIAAGLTQAEALREYGVASGMALPVLFAPSTAIGALALVLSPSLSESFFKKDGKELKRSVESAIKTTATIACCLFPFLFALGADMGELLFSDGESGKMIALCSPIVLPLSLNMISSSILNAMQKERKTLLHYAISSAIMLAAIMFLPRFIGVYALAAGMFASFAVSATLNLIAIQRTCPLKPKYMKNILKAAFSAIPSAAAGKLVYSLMNKLFSAIPAIIVTSAITAGIIFVLLWALKPISLPSLKNFLIKNPHKY